MKILHVLDKLSVDGSQIHGPARQVSYRVPCYGEKAVVLVVSLRAEEPAAQLLRDCGITVRCLGRGKFDFRQLADLRRIIREWKPDVVHLSGYAAWNFGRVAAAMARCPVVVQEHFVDPRTPVYQRLADRLLKGRQQWAIAVSPSVKEFMVRQRHVKAGQIEVIGNGIPLKRVFRRSAQANVALRAKLDIAAQAKVVGVVGRLAEQKGHAYFLQAAKQIAAQMPETVFLIVGEGPLRQSLQQQAQQLGLEGRIRWTGFQPEVADYLSICDVSVISSIYGEGFCSVGIESMAAGAAVVMTDIACVEGSFAHERNVLCVPIRDAAAITEAVVRLLTQPALAQQLVSEGAKLAQNCRIESVAQRYLDCYERAIAGAGHGKAVRVCFFTGSFYPMLGGGETYARNIAGRLSQLGAAVFVLTRRVIMDSPRIERIDGVEVVRIGPSGKAPLAKYLMLPEAAFTLWRRRREYDVLLVSNFRAIGAAAVLFAKLLGKRCVLRAGICGEFSGEYVAASGNVPRQALPWLAAPLALRTALLRQADGFISNCGQISEEFQRHGVARDRIMLMPGGVDTDVFHPASAGQRAQLRAQLGLPAQRYLIGYSGKLNRGKGIEHLIAALPAIIRQKPDAHLLVIGGGANQSLSQEETLRKQVGDAGLADCVTFTGYVRNMPDFLRSLDCFVLPTEYEALPNALMEAMACGLACVATRVGGIPDLIEDGVSGLLIEPKSPQAIAQAVAALAQDGGRAALLGAAAREAMQKRFSLEALARRHVEYLGSFANGAAH